MAENIKRIWAGLWNRSTIIEIAHERGGKVAQ